MGAWEITMLIIAEVLITLAAFSAIIALIVFSIRNPIRKHKPIDMLIFDKIKPGVNAINNKIMLFITFLGKHQFLIPANLFLISYFLLVKKQNWFSIRVITIAISSLVLMLLLKQLFQRKRPLSPLLKAAKGLSFPSGHAMGSIVIYGMLTYLLILSFKQQISKFIVTTMVVFILLIGFSRLYLGAHYFSDVMAGYVAGLGWLGIVISGTEIARRHKRGRSSSETLLEAESEVIPT